MASFVSLISSQDFIAAAKVLDAEIHDARQDYDMQLHRLVQLHLNRGICNQRLHLYRKSLKDFDAALALMPSNVKALLHKGQVLVGLGKPAEARVVWETAATLADPTSDLEILLDIQQALSGVASRHSSSAGASSSSTKPSLEAAAAAAAADSLLEAAAPPAPAPATPPLASSEADVAAAPQPQKTPAAGIAAHPTDTPATTAYALAPAATREPAAAAAAAIANGAAAPAAASPKVPQPQQKAAAAASSSKKAPLSSSVTAAAATTADSKSSSKINKGFFKSSSSGSSGSSSSNSKGSGSSVPAARPKSSSGDAEAVEEIDCAAQQEQQQQQSKAGPASFGERVQQMQQHSVVLQIAITQINAGQVEQAEQLLDSILSSTPRDLSALVARGTARALQRKLKEAEHDFTLAINLEPRYPDTYKRRGQARSAMGDLQGALEDLEKAAKLLEDAARGNLAGMVMGGPDGLGSPADCYQERGVLYQKLRDFRRAVKELKKAVDADPSNAQSWNYLGLARVSMGDIREGCKDYNKALELAPDMKEAWLNLGQALKEEGRVKEAERALTQALTDVKGTPCLAAYRLLATMRQGAGRQAAAIKLLDKAINHKKDEPRAELLYLRAICYHALGYAHKAVADYTACMHCPQRPDDGPLAEEARAFQFLSFYQKELALWVAHNLDTRVADICLDVEMSPEFKECWCKKGPPDAKVFSSHKMMDPLPSDGSSSRSSSSNSTNTSPRASSSGPSSSTSPSSSGPSSRVAGPDCSSPTQGLSDAGCVAGYAEQVAALMAAADTVGSLLQNHHQGFLPNVRQQRASGYAALQLAQTVRALLIERAAGREGLWVNSEGASGQGGCSGRHLFGWRDAMDIVVKWRQLSEPADQVVWVDLLTQQEFEAGFGSHTPMYSGQTKCVRYYMNFARAMDVAKECLLELGHAYDAQNHEVPLGSDDKKDSVKRAKTALELYRVIGQDSWVVVPLYSILKHQQQPEQPQQQSNGSSSTSSSRSNSPSPANKATANGPSKGSSKSSSSSSRRVGVQPVHVPDGCVEGTRLTLVNVPNQPDAVEFSIRTPVTPPRWKEFDAELDAAWERVIHAMLSGDKHVIATAIMCYAYYWYNFMPLARGTAAVGYTTMLGLFWAAGMPITTPIPKDYQVDWEAILAKHPKQFVNRLAEWFVPKAACPPAPVPTTTPAEAEAAAANGDCSSSSISGGNPTAASTSVAAANGSSSSPESSSVSQAAAQLPDVESLPQVSETLATFRQRLNALNGPDAKPV